MSLRKILLGACKSRETECLAHQPDMDGRHGHSILERHAHMQDMLRHRLADLTAEQPSLKALYDSLTPDQKQVLDHGGSMRRSGSRGHGDWHRRDYGPDKQAD